MFDKNPDFASWSVKEVGTWLRGLLKTTIPDFDAKFILEKLKDLVNGQSLLTFTAKDFEKNKIPSGIKDRIKKELKTLGLTSTTKTVEFNLESSLLIGSFKKVSFAVMELKKLHWIKNR
jgi:hypothetical protein